MTTPPIRRPLHRRADADPDPFPASTVPGLRRLAAELIAADPGDGAPRPRPATRGRPSHPAAGA
ncbi:hypothetical protein ACIGXI_31870 [Kitasatospora aureofaciens]|uniref:hypothetical protein n=1 Tax=Kitasatospora aureofaciens TaxID=1894 RepID=UPI0037CC9AFF